MELSNTVALAQKLVRIKSVTPDDNGCQCVVKAELAPLGFDMRTVQEHGVTNLLALHGKGAPFLLFLGHTDVVPTGDEADWDHPPFCGDIYDYDGKPYLYGRGSSDMKGGDAAMITALKEFVKNNPSHSGTVGILLTSNEEGDAVGGTPFMVDYLKEHNLIPDYCLIGECSCDDVFGDSIKNGRRGDLNATIVIEGIQGHAAMEQYAKNAVFEASRFIQGMIDNPIDKGTEFFPPTSFQVSNVHAGTGADNVIPGSCTLRCNFRWNDLQTPESVENHVREVAQSLNIKCTMDFRAEGDPFLTKDGELIEALRETIKEVTGITPSLGTSGGTSDGRFVRPLGTQTVEFGPVAALIHKVNERVSVDELDKLTQIFTITLRKLIK
ncbi:MAG: succinyl-diaminopimelate desuccinylase [Succinivibrio sp.]